MDELSALPPETSWKRSTRIRTSSLNPRYAYTNPSPSTTRAESPFRPNTNALTVNTEVYVLCSLQLSFPLSMRYGRLEHNLMQLLSLRQPHGGISSKVQLANIG